MVWIFRFFDFLSIVLPIQVAYLVSELLGIATYFLGLYRKGKKHVVENLKQAGISSHGLSSFISFARLICEFMIMLKLNKKNLGQWMEVFGMNKLKKEFNKRKGVIVLTGHLGNWELGAAMLALFGYPTNVVSIRWRGKAMAEFYMRRRKRKGLKVIYIEDVRSMLKVLKRGEILALLGDKVYSGEGAKVEFFGKKVRFPLGAFQLAYLTQAPILIAFAVREKGRIKVYFEKPIYIRNKEEIKQGLFFYVKVLEKYIQKYPSQWCAYEKIF